MTKAVQRRKGTDSEHSTFTGLEAEITVNTTNQSVHVHDGSTAGGFELARADGSNVDDFAVGGNLTVTGNTTINGTLTLGDADTDSITINADLTSNLIPNADDTYDIGSATKEWKDIYIDGTAYIDAINFNGTAITATGAELNYVDGVTSAIQTQIDGKQDSDAQLTDIAGLTPTDGNFIVGDGANFVAESGATARASLGLGSIATQDSASISVTGGTIDGVTIGGSSAGAGTFTTLTANTSITGTLATAAQPNITSVGTLTGFTSTGIDDNGTSTAITIDSSENVGIGTTSPAQLLHVAGSGSTPFATQRNVNSGGFAMIQGKMGDSASTSAGHVYSALVAGIEDNTNGAEDGYFALEVSEGGSGSEKLRVTSSGYVGIGTSSPDTLLNISGDSNSSDIMLELKNSKYDSTDTSGETGILFGWNNHKAAKITAFKEGVVNRTGFKIIGEAGFNVPTTIATFMSTGNVGIGTSSPESKLAVKGSSGSADLFSISDTTVPTSGAEYGTAMIKTNSTEYALNITSYNANGKGLKVYNNGGQNAFLISQAGGDRFVVDGSGNVGIGTSSPISLGAGTQGITIEGSAGGFTNYQYNAANTGYVVAASGALSINTFTGKSLVLGTEAVERMRIDTSGNLLVGRTSSGSTGNGHTIRGGDSAIFSRDAAGESMQVCRNASAGDLVRFYCNGVDKGSIDFDGSNTISYTSSSDQRLKENIVDAPSASDDIDAIQVRSFDWKADGSHQKYGMVAQELQTVAPEAVSGDADSDEMMGVDYSKLVPMLVKEIQSLRARVAQLEN